MLNKFSLFVCVVKKCGRVEGGKEDLNENSDFFHAKNFPSSHVSYTTYTFHFHYNIRVNS